MNEHIARRANLEDGCKGRFWEGRFYSKKVESIEALIAVSVYIDLNPIRARVCKSLPESKHTSVYQRLMAYTQGKRGEVPLVSISSMTDHGMTTKEYIRLVEAMGKIQREGKGSIPPEVILTLSKINFKGDRFLRCVDSIKKGIKRIIAPAEVIVKKVERAGKRWFQGISIAKAVFA